MRTAENGFGTLGQVRALQKSDLDAVLDVWLNGNLDAHPFVPEEVWKGHLAQVREALPRADAHVFTNLNGGILGFIGLDGAYIEGIFVRRDVRGRSVGSALMGCAKALHSELALSVYAQNRAAIRFYQREGFGIVNESVDVETGNIELRMNWHR